MSGISRNAPELIILGDKWEADNEQRISVADRLIKAIGTNKRLKANERLLLIILLGQAQKGFHISEKWILDRTGMGHDTYLNCKKHLKELGYIDYKEYNNITIDITKLEDF